MNAIIGMTAIAKSSSELEKKDYCLDRIKNASAHLLGIINDILDMSKIEANRFDLSYAEFDFEKMLARVAGVMEFKVQEKQQDFFVNCDDDVPEFIICDEQRLAQVIANLLSNAVKFTPNQGSIAVNVRKLEEKDRICAIQVEVSDTGIGISVEQQAQLFNSFVQADNSSSRKFGGAGLGLAISKRIVEMMGGKIWVESELGKGSAFKFYFQAERGLGPQKSGATESAPQPCCLSAPARDDSEEQRSAEETKAAVDLRFEGKRILLAEDVELNREIVIALLEPYGLKINCAENGAQAVREFEEHPYSYDIIFMDVHMPEMDGYEATRRIRSLPIQRSKEIPIIAMTANVFAEDVEKCRIAGMNAHVGKPLDMERVMAVLIKYTGPDYALLELPEA
jgi:CheY-like chemotaxis protein/two-component sensor histidine kinase